MAWSISDLFGPWGDGGERPPDNFQYDGGDQVNEKHIDYLWDNVRALEDEVRSALTDIDSDKDGVVDRANEIVASYVGDGLNGGDTTSLSVDVSDFAGHGLEDSGSNDLRLDAADISTGINGGDGTDLSLNESVIKEGGAKEIDASEFDASAGTNNEVLTSDGSSASWSSVSVSAPIYSDGRDGGITDSSNVTRSGVLEPTDYTLQNGNTLTVGSPGYLVIIASNSITIDGTIDATGAAASGGSGGNPGTAGGNAEIYPLGAGGAGGSSSNQTGAAGGDGGDGDTSSIKTDRNLGLGIHYAIDALDAGTQSVGAGGGGGGDGQQISTSPATPDNGSAPGGGGTGAGDQSASTQGGGGTGGDGGGGVILIAPSITISGTIQAAGTDGGDGADAEAPGGGAGGGSGGLIFLNTDDLNESTPTYDVSKGTGGVGGSSTGGNNGNSGGDGADGADGRIMKVL